MYFKIVFEVKSDKIFISRGPILSISDVHWTHPFSGFYMFNVDASRLIDEGKWGIGFVVIDNEGVVVAASC